MAVTARFQADFSGFIAAIDKAEIALVDMSKGASKVESSLNRMVDNFSGRKLIQEASLMTIALEKAGGISTLTAKELEVVGNKANDAADKMKRLGYEVPAGLQKLADATKDASTAGLDMNATFKAATSVLSAFGVTLSIGAVVAFGKELFAAADQLMKLHDTTGVSIEGLQRFEAAGADAGNTVEDITSAIVKMEDKLVSGDKSAAGAVAKLGLNFADLQKLSPENQFIAISDAIRLIQDPAEQVNIAIDLFGKQGATVLPVLKRGFDDLKGSSVGASRETIAAIDDLGDHFGRFWALLKTNSSEALGDVLTLSLSSTRALNSEITALAEAAERAAPKIKGLLPPSLPADLDAINAKFDAEAKLINENMTPAAIAFRAAMVELDSVGVGFQGTLDGISGSVVEAIKFYLEAGVSQGTLATAYGLTATQIKAVATAMSEELATAKVLHDFLSTAAKNQAVLDDRAMKAVNDKILAIIHAQQAAEAANAAFLKGARDDAQAQDKLNGIIAQTPPQLNQIPPAIDAATAAAKAFHDELNGIQQLLVNTDLGAALPILGGPSQGATRPHLTGQARAGGGPVSAGSAYLVGERGPELFIPRGSGSILPNGGGGGMAVTVNITQPLGTPSAIAAAVREAMVAYQRNRARL